jgi:hypothetical protein
LSATSSLAGSSSVETAVVLLTIEETFSVTFSEV